MIPNTFLLAEQFNPWNPKNAFLLNNDPNTHGKEQKIGAWKQEIKNKKTMYLALFMRFWRSIY